MLPVHTVIYGGGGSGRYATCTHSNLRRGVLGDMLPVHAVIYGGGVLGDMLPVHTVI